MSYKDTNIVNPGTATQYGADDLEKISRLLNGVTTGVGGPMIKTQEKFGFWDAILYFRNQADTKSITIRGPTNTPSSDVDLGLPPITANDLLAALGVAQTWSAKQRYDAGIVFPQIATPAAPGSGLHQVYVGTNGHLMKTDNSLVTKDYDLTASSTPIKIQDGSLALRMFDALVTRVGSTYYAIKSDGTVISSGSNPNTVIQAAIDITGTILISGINISSETIFDLQSGFAGFTIPTLTYVYLNKGVNIRVPNAYTGYVFNIRNKESGIISDGGYLKEQGSASRLWTGVKVGQGTSGDAITHVVLRGFFVYQAGKAIEFAQGSTGFIQLVEVSDVQTNDCIKQIVWTSSSSTLISDIVIRNSKFLATSSITTDGFKTVTGTRNQFFGNMFKGFTGSMNEMDLTANAVDTMVFGGNHTGVVGTYTDLGTNTYVDDPTHTEFKFKGTAVSPSQITANQNDYNPTGWNEKQNALRLSSDASRNITGLVPGSNPKNRMVTIFNIGSNAIVLKDDDGATSTAANRFALNSDITILADQSVTLFYDSTTSRWRAISSPVASSTSGVALLAASNTFTDVQIILKDTTAPLLELQRPSSTVTNLCRLDLELWNASSALKTYGRMAAEIITNTAGAEDGKLHLYVMVAGTLTDIMQVEIDRVTMAKNAVLSGGLSSVRVAKTGNYTLTAQDSTIEADASAGGFTLTLPAAATTPSGKIYEIIRTDQIASTNILTIDANASETIDGLLTWRMSPGEKLVIKNNGSNWIVLRYDNPSYSGYLFVKNSTNNRRYMAGLMTARSVLITSTTSPAANTLWALPFIVSKVTKFDTISFNITTAQASQNARAGIYFDNGNMYPGELLFDTGSISTGTTGVKDTTITSSLQLFQPGLYWLVWETNATTIQIRSLGNTSVIFAFGADSTLSTTNPGYGYSVAHTFGTLPNPYTAGATLLTADPAVGAPIPAIGLRPI